MSKPHNEPPYPPNRPMAETHPEHGICPVITSTFPVAGAPGTIQPAGGTTIGTIVAQAPCMGAVCQLWDPDAAMCSIKSKAHYFRGILACLQGGLAELRKAPE